MVHWHHVSLLGCSTPARFWESLTSSDTADGFLARLLVWEDLRDAPFPGDIKEMDSYPLKQAFNDLWNLPVEIEGDLARILKPVTVTKTPEAKELFLPWARNWHNLKNQHKDDSSGKAALYSRAAEHGHKLALVKAISRCGDKIPIKKVEVEDVQFAMALVDYLVPRLVRKVGENISDNDYEALQKRILKAVRKCAMDDPERGGANISDMLQANRTKKAQRPAGVRGHHGGCWPSH